MKGFLKIYKYNKIHAKGEKTNQKALNIQFLILAIVIIIMIFNAFDYKEGNYYWFLDQFDRIYALLIAVVLTVIVTFNTILKNSDLNKIKPSSKKITYKEDYMSVIMYTLFLYFVGITFNVIYAVFLQYLNIEIINVISWGISLFLLLDAIYFTCYTIEELNKLLNKV